MIKAERQIKKKQLSKSILDMKFMKKSKEAFQAAEEAEEGRALFASELTEAMRLGGLQCVVEPSFVPCEDLVVPRRSYHGMNPEVEKLNSGKKETQAPVEEDVDVAAEEMALNSSMARRFERGGNKPPRKRARFQKPAED